MKQGREEKKETDRGKNRGGNKYINLVYFPPTDRGERPSEYGRKGRERENRKE